MALVIVVFVAFAVIIYVLMEAGEGLSGRSGYIQRLKKYRQLYIGMYEGDMLAIMGPGYSVAQLKDGSIKYTWSLSGKSKARGSGTWMGSVHASSYVTERDESKRVVVVVENEKVVEIIPYNV